MIVKGLLVLLAVLCVLMGLLIWAKSGQAAVATQGFTELVQVA